jgi:hypothetical protein
MNIEYFKEKYLLCSPIHEWINLNDYKLVLYYRLNKRMINKEIVDSLDLANIQISSKHRNKRYFSKFINDLEQEMSQFHIVIFVESIINPILSSYLQSIGYSILSKDMDINIYCSMYKQL